MKIKIFFILIFLFIISIQSISQNNYSFSDYNGFNLDSSILPKDEILHGGPPKDGIPAILNPKFTKINEAIWLEDDDLVAGLEFNGIKKAYPIRILVWHELVNDDFNDFPVLITYCPLCGSILAFKRNIKDQLLTFGVSGLLYQSDVLFYDHNTNSLWSQLLMKSISGEFVGTNLELLPYTLSTWKEWRLSNPDSKVLSKNTGYHRDYDKDPYGSYENSSNLYFPVKRKSKKFHPKEKVLVVLSDYKSKVYSFTFLKSVNTKFEDKIGDKRIFITSKNGNYIDVEDEKGIKMNYFTSYWFAWYAFRPDTEVYK